MVFDYEKAFYTQLDISSSASLEEIEQAFSRKLRQIIYSGREGILLKTDLTSKLFIAYSVLSNAILRQVYHKIDFYHILDVPTHSSMNEVKKAFRKLAKKYHPDSNPDNPEAEHRFKEISVAYEILGDPVHRQFYDKVYQHYQEWCIDHDDPFLFDWPSSAIDQEKDGETRFVGVMEEITIEHKLESHMSDIEIDIPSPLLLPEQIQTEEVYFRVYFPQEVQAEKWHSLLAYAFINSAIEEVATDAAKFTDEIGASPRSVTYRRPARLRRGTDLRLIPESEGITFKPSYLELKWEEDFERGIFRFTASNLIVGEPCFGEMLVYVGLVEIARVKFSIFITGPQEESVSNSVANPKQTHETKDSMSNPLAQAKMKESVSQMYQKIFISYSREDTEIAKAFRLAQLAAGNDVFLDTESIRSGENWQGALASAIDEAEVFQLFWSESSAASTNVRDEWDYALNYKCRDDRCRGFIRPVYWKKPMPSPPSELGHLNFRYVPFLGEDEDR